MARKRDYLPIGKNPRYNLYHKTYDRLRINSQVLNGGSMHPNFDTVFFDELGIKDFLYKINGDDTGKIYNKETEEWSEAWIPLIEHKLKLIDKRFKNLQQQKVNEGYSRPEEMPEEMLEQKLLLEAKLSVYKEEATELEKRLKKLQKEADKEHKGNVLKHGCREATKLRNGIVDHIDYQNVSLNKNNMLIIDDPVSPYNQMLVADYRMQICRPWCALTSKLRNMKAALSRKLIAKGLYAEEFEKQWQEQQDKLFKQNPGWKRLFKIKLDDKPPIPEIPKQVKLYKTTSS